VTSVPKDAVPKDAVAAGVAASADTAIGLSRALYAEPEIRWQEFKSAARVASVLADAGFAVEAPYCGMPTAFRAVYGSGPLRIALCAEYDALPGIGHACGHNMIASISSTAAVALTGLADSLGLTVIVLGTPAEEGGGGKVRMISAGVFDDVHAAMMVHPGPVDVIRAQPYAVSHLRIGFSGAAAHAAAYPELGRNAADAFTIAQVAIGLLRQQLPATVRVHGVVTNGGAAPNIIPDVTEGRWYVRASTTAELDDLEPRVRRCFEAGALATGCDVSIEEESPRYAEFRTDADLSACYERNAVALGRVFTDPADHAASMARASTDMGNVSQVVPAIHPYVGIGSLPAVNHQAAFTAHTITPEADRALLDSATALAQTVVDAATDPALRERLLAG
jgi:amidohydrolase